MDYLAVAIAGFGGAVSRAVLGKIIKASFPLIFPFGTMLINITGCFALSLLMNLSLERYRINPRLRLALGTGFLGAYTTFSTFSVDSVNLIQENQIYLALSYIIFTAFGCVCSAWLGHALSRVITERKPPGKAKSKEGN